MIEGNRLEPNQIEAVLKHAGHFPGRARGEGEYSTSGIMGIKKGDLNGTYGSNSP